MKRAENKTKESKDCLLKTVPPNKTKSFFQNFFQFGKKIVSETSFSTC